MTTIVATLESMAADQFVTYAPSYHGDTKIWIARGSIWGAAGDCEACLRFKNWTLGRGPRPKTTPEDPDDKDGAKVEVLQLSPKGLFLYNGDSPPDAVKEPFYAIGSGGGYAVGALSAKATLAEALDIAAKWDANTRAPFNVISLSDLKKRKR